MVNLENNFWYSCSTWVKDSYIKLLFAVPSWYGTHLVLYYEESIIQNNYIKHERRSVAAHKSKLEKVI